MGQLFYKRLRDYYIKVGQVLRGEADAAAVFPNPSDLGIAREFLYAEFLRQHAPSKCNVYLGGFLFGGDGTESKQLDVMISTDTAPQYNFYNRDGRGKSFGPVDGCLGVASIKSTLDKAQLYDSLDNIASIPVTQPVSKNKNPLLRLDLSDNWPYKIIYATKGLKAETVLKHITEFYGNRPDIPVSRRPDIVHVAGDYVLFNKKDGMGMFEADGSESEIEIGSYSAVRHLPDVQAIMWVLHELQTRATISTHIIFDYDHLVNGICDYDSSLTK